MAGVDFAKWIAEQPDAIPCPALGKGKMTTLAACKARLASKFHYKRKKHAYSERVGSGDAVEVPFSFQRCIDSGCPHYEDTARLAPCNRSRSDSHNTLKRRLNEP